MQAKPGLTKQIAACSLLFLSSLHLAQAAPSASYLQIGDGRMAYVFRWLLPDGTVLKQGMTDNHGLATLVQRPGGTDYILETTWGAYRVKVPNRCWKLKPENFASCVKVSPREDSEVQKQETEESNRNAQAERLRRELKATWMQKEIPADQQERLIQDTVAAHQAWMKTPAAEFPADGFACRLLDLPAPSAEATESFEQGKSLPRGEKQEQAHIEAARRGHWRAVSRLANSAMEDEDWESAQPNIAWLLKNNIPSGYAKLADLIAATSAYDGAPVASSTKQLVTSLRWRAAQLGDPVAQSQMSQYFTKTGRTQLAQDLLTCAQRQNPEIRWFEDIAVRRPGRNNLTSANMPTPERSENPRSNSKAQAPAEHWIQCR